MVRPRHKTGSFFKEERKMKKAFILFLCLAMVFSLAACGSSSSASTASDSAAPAEDGTYVVGICQLVQHVALDAATKGFRDAITEKLGDKVTFIEQNAAGDSANCSTICNQLVSEKVDLIMANATPALQAAAASTNTIPILGTSITDYGSALDIDNWTGVTGTNISGTSDLAPLDDQAKLFGEILPNAHSVGIIYCSAEANSVYQADVIEGYLKDAGLEVKRYSFADSNDLAGVTANACAENDALYIPTDNTAASFTETINNVAQPAGVPIICGEEGLCSGCGVATLSISYYDLGTVTGEMAAKILAEGADVSTMEIQYAPFAKKFNKTNCDILGITVPEAYEAIAE